MKIDQSSSRRLIELSYAQMSPGEAFRFIERIQDLQSEALFHNQERTAPVGQELKDVRRDIAALDRVIALFSASEDPRRDMVSRLKSERDWLQMSIDHAKEIGIRPAFKEKAVAEIIVALADGLQINPSSVSRGANPDNGKVSHQFPIVQAALEFIGISESAISTYQRMGRAIAAQREKHAEEQAMAAWD